MTSNEYQPAIDALRHFRLLALGYLGDLVVRQYQGEEIDEETIASYAQYTEGFREAIAFLEEEGNPETLPFDGDFEAAFRRIVSHEEAVPEEVPAAAEEEAAALDPAAIEKTLTPAQVYGPEGQELRRQLGADAKAWAAGVWAKTFSDDDLVDALSALDTSDRHEARKRYALLDLMQRKVARGKLTQEEHDQILERGYLRAHNLPAPTREMRAWAQTQPHLSVSDRGRLSEAVIDAYRAAHPDARP